MSDSSDLAAAQASYEATLADLGTKALAAKTAEQARWREAVENPGLRLVVLRECLEEALNDWAYAAQYKNGLEVKHGDYERIAEMRALLVSLGGKA